MAPHSGGEQFYPGPSPASPSPATRAPNRLQRERGEAPRQSTVGDRGGGRGGGWWGVRVGGQRGSEEELLVKRRHATVWMNDTCTAKLLLFFILRDEF